MLDKWCLWRYRDDNNCWDFVCEFIKDKSGIEIDRFRINPHDKREVTDKETNIIGSYHDCDAKNLSIACVYRGKYLFHVGVVFCGFVHHVGKSGYRRQRLEDFEKLGSVKYRCHTCLL